MIKTMINFLGHSWKTVLYPVAIICIILFDQLMGFSVYTTIFKILVFSIIHIFVVSGKYEKVDDIFCV